MSPVPSNFLPVRRASAGGPGLRLHHALALAVAACLPTAAFAAASDDRPELALGRTPLYDYDPPVPGSYRLPTITVAADGDVLDADGDAHRLYDYYDGRVTLVSFIYTRCRDPNACPYVTGALYQIHEISQEDPELAANLRLVTFSFDPEHDTPRVMKAFGDPLAGNTNGGAPWEFLTTSGTKQIGAILAAYGLPVARKRNKDDPLGPFYHQLRVYLVDGAGNVRNIYSFGLLDPRMVLTDVRTLILERTKTHSRLDPRMQEEVVRTANRPGSPRPTRS